MRNITTSIAFFFFTVLHLSVCGYAAPMTRVVPAQYGTIQDAINAANDGDTVVVSPGIYLEKINFSGKTITVTSQDPSDLGIVLNTIIDAGGVGSVVTFANGEGRDSILQGITITGGYGTLNTAYGENFYWGAGIYCYESSPTIRGNVVTGNNAPLIEMDGEDVSKLRLGGGIACINSNAAVDRNIIKNNSAYYGAGIMNIPSKITITNNLIINNSGEIGGAVALFGGELINNTLAGNTATTGVVYVAVDSELGQSIVLNNIIANSVGGYGLVWAGSDGYENISYNVFWNNTFGDYGSIPAQTGLNGNISADPLFANADGHDYHLLIDSPCINAGDPDFITNESEKDIDGDSRIFATRVDIGADEYTGNMKPSADAGPDQYLGQAPSFITLDGGGSYFEFPEGYKEFQWLQLEGPAVLLSDDTAVNPSFDAVSYGVYVFQLVISDAEYESLPDTVTVSVVNAPPVVDAGIDQSFNDIPVSVTLDGSGSYDAAGESISYSWLQISGETVTLYGFNTVNPSFVPEEVGVYVFELTVNDGTSSISDTVLVKVGNSSPILVVSDIHYISDAYFKLNLSNCYDPDSQVQLTLNSDQVSGTPQLTISDDGTVTGFTSTDNHQLFEFEVSVSDGDTSSMSKRIKVIVTANVYSREGVYGFNSLVQENQSFDPSLPTFVYLGGGNGRDGGSGSLGSPWNQQANVLYFADYANNPPNNTPNYKSCAAMLISYLSSVTYDYKEQIQMAGFSTGTTACLDIAKQINRDYANYYGDFRFAVNRVSTLDIQTTYAGHAQALLDSLLENKPKNGEPCWVDNYRANGKYLSGALNIHFPGGSHGDPPSWFLYASHDLVNPNWDATTTDFFNGGITAGWFISVCGPMANLDFSGNTDSYFKWTGNYDWSNPVAGHLALYSLKYVAKLPEPIKLIGPNDGDTIDGYGAVFSCQPSQNAVGYQLLMGPDPYDMKHVISDTPTPPQELITVFPYETTYWTIKARDQYGSTIHADPICVKIKYDDLISNPFDRDYLKLLDYEIMSQKRISRTKFEYRFRMKVKNMFIDSVRDVTVKLSSTPANITVLNDKLFFRSLPSLQEIFSDDTFTIIIDHTQPANEKDLVWEITDEPQDMTGDINSDYVVNSDDLALLAGNWLGSYPNEGLEAYWPLEYSDNNDAFDISNNGNNATVVATANYVDGISGKALNFDGVSDYVAVDNFSITGNEITLTAWVNGSGPDWAGIISTRDPFIRGVFVGPGNQLRYSWNESDKQDWLWDSGPVIPEDEWVMVAMVIEPDKTTVYVCTEGSGIVSAVNTTVNGVATMNNIKIGWEEGEPNRKFNGIIDEVAVYSKALNGQEIQQLYSNPSVNPTVDLNYDGVVNLTDLAEIAKHWQMQN